MSNHIFTVSDLELSNVFSSLDDSMDESSIFNTDEIVTSSPKPSQSRFQKDQGSNRKPKPIKVMLVHCIWSLKSERKQYDFLDLVETHKPDIICGQESHINCSFSTSEMFPTGYIVSSKDRDIHGGGVFVAVSDQIISTTEFSLDSKGKIMWCKISMKGAKPLYKAFFYRPTNENPQPLIALNEPLSKLSQNGTLPYMILGGDFT